MKVTGAQALIKSLEHEGVEVIFGLPGIGSLTADTLGGFDLPPIVALAVYLGIVVVFARALVDLVVAWLDPRLRRSQAHA